jgi:hypothetical protein
LYQSLWKIYGIQSDPRPPIDPHLELTGDDLDETGIKTPSSYRVLSKLHLLSLPSQLVLTFFSSGIIRQLTQFNSHFATSLSSILIVSQVLFRSLWPSRFSRRACR